MEPVRASSIPIFGLSSVIPSYAWSCASGNIIDDELGEDWDRILRGKIDRIVRSNNHSEAKCGSRLEVMRIGTVVRIYPVFCLFPAFIASSVLLLQSILTFAVI